HRPSAPPTLHTRSPPPPCRSRTPPSPPPPPDSDRCTVVEQVANGVSIRMAVLYLLLGGSDTALSAAPARTEENK
ncbi:hypothetical protein ACFV0W_22940, partial [Streptomyces anulatus]